MFYNTQYLQTPRLKMAFFHAGRNGLPRLLFIHGNCSSGIFYQPLMKRLEDQFEMIAPDLRCFGDTQALPIDATRGMRDFSDDIHALVEALGWEHFSILGWSLGGGVAMQYAIDHCERLENIILEAPLSPFGFGGTYGEDGKKLEPFGLASGGGCANVQLIEALKTGDRAFAAQTLDSVYVEPPYQIDPEWKELFIDSILSTRTGEGMYPGSKKEAMVWPFFAAGDDGVCNTMSPPWCDLSDITEIPKKPPILWIRGSGDIMVRDESMMDLVNLGKMGLVPGYPGEELCPPQPMLAQTRYVLEKYAASGGYYEEKVIAGGHGCMLDNEEVFAQTLLQFLHQK